MSCGFSSFVPNLGIENHIRCATIFPFFSHCVLCRRRRAPKWYSLEWRSPKIVTILLHTSRAAALPKFVGFNGMCSVAACTILSRTRYHYCSNNTLFFVHVWFSRDSSNIRPLRIKKSISLTVLTNKMPWLTNSYNATTTVSTDQD